jgi:dihydrolipoamide dehydrogenase
MDNQNKKFDIAVLGGGPGGYPAAIRAAQNGKKVALIEAKELGGTCLNRGCIPSKSLIAHAEVLQTVKDAKNYGIDVGDIRFHYEKMVQRKNLIVEKLCKNVEGLLKSNNVTLIRGFGKFDSPTRLKISGDSSMMVEADNIIIATGSEPRNMSAFPFDYKRVHDSTSLLQIREVPKTLTVIGGGIIGCEFASLFSMLGSQVTILELMPRIIPMESVGVSAALTKTFLKKGIQIETSVSVQRLESHENGVNIYLAGDKRLSADSVLVSVGRQLNTTAIGLEKIGVKVHENGLVAVNDRMQTNIPGIYAIGDIASKWWLAHVATHQGLVAADNASGKSAHMRYNAVPSVIFTHPEIATVGLSLEQALEMKYPAIVGEFPFQALGKSQATLQTDGFAQIVTDKKTGQILGAQVVGHDASTLIAEMGVAITNELTLESITETLHAHPTLAEVWMEAAFVTSESPLHFPPKKSRIL